MAIVSNLVARLRAETAAFDRKINKSRRQMSTFTKGVQTMGRQMLAIAGVGGGIYAMKRGFESIIKAAMEQEKAERALMAATKGSIGQFKTFAAEMQRLTTYGDEEILNQMAYAKNLGVTSNKLKEAAMAAAGLSSKFRIDLASAMMLVGRASQGQTTMLTRYGIVLDKTLTDSQKFNELLRIGKENFRLAAEQTLTAAGSYGQFKNAVGDIAELFGGPFLSEITKTSRAMTKMLQDNSLAAAKFAEFTGGKMAPQVLTAFEVTAKSVGYFLSGIQTTRAAAIQLSAGLLQTAGYGASAFGKLTESVLKTNNAIAKTWVGRKMGFVAGPERSQMAAWAESLKKEARDLDNMATELMLNLPSIKIGEGFKELRKELEKTGKDIAEAIEALSEMAGEGVGFEESIKSAAAQEKAVLDVAAAQRAMFKDMKIISLENYQFRLRTIQDLQQKYLDAGLARAQVEQWSVEQIKRLDIERLRSSQNMFDGIRAATKEMQLEMKTFGDIGYEAAMTLQRGFGSAFADVTMRIKTAKDALRGLAMSVARVTMTRLGENIYAGILSSITGGLFAPAQIAGSSAFTSPHGGPAAPGLQHGGEVLETGLALVHRGERFSGQGGGMPAAININVINNTDTKIRQKGPTAFDGHNYIVNLEAILDDRIKRNAGPLRNTIENLSR